MITSFVLTALTACLAIPAFAQQDVQDNVWVNESKKDGVLLEQAASLEKNGQFDEAVDKYLQILSSAEDGMMPTSAAAPRSSVHAWQSCKSVARRKVAGMCPAVLMSYAARHDKEARELVTKAGKTESVEDLALIAGFFPGTVHARNAASQAGDIAAERGEFDLAADLFESAAKNSLPFSVEWMRYNVKRALCLARAGKTHEIDKMLKDIETVRMSRDDCGIIILPASAFSRFARAAMSVPIEFVSGMKTSYVSAVQASGRIAALCTEASMREKEASCGFAADACLEEKPAWKIALSNLFGRPDEFSFIDHGCNKSPVVPVVKCVNELVPGARPFVAEGDLYVTDGEKAFRVDIASGACSELGAIRANAGSALGTCGNFRIPETGSAADGMIIFMMRGEWAGHWEMARHGIAAFRLTSEKKIEPLWDTEGAVERGPDGFLDKASFASAPVFVERNLLAAALTCAGDVQWHLCGLGSASGAVEFNTLIGGFKIPTTQSVSYVNAPSVPTVSGESAFMCTNGGVAACISIVDGEMKWAVDYSGAAPLAGQGMFFNLECPRGWADNPPVVLGDCVLFAPQDSDILLAVRRADGACLDTVRRTTGNYKFLASGPNETAVLAGSSLLPLSCDGDRLVKGTKCELQEEVCGRPFALADGLIVSTRKALYHVRYSNGRWAQPREILRWTDKDDPPLEVLPAGGFLIVVTKAELMAFQVVERK